MKTCSQKIALVIPNDRWENKRPWVLLPHNIGILTAIIKDEFNLHIIDANGENMSKKQCSDKISEIAPDIVLLSVISNEYFGQSDCVAEMAKKINPGIVVIMGGACATVLPEEILNRSSVDYVFLGHAEERLPSLLKYICEGKIENIHNFDGIAFRSNGRIVVNPQKTYIGDLKKLYKPDYSLINIQNYINNLAIGYQHKSNVKSASIVSSYGCPYKCVFCASRAISGHKTIYRPFNDLIEEIDMLVSQHGVQNLVFIDDNFLADKTRIQEVLNYFITHYPSLTWNAVTVAAWHLSPQLLELMRKSGCTKITISVESGSQRVLRDIIHKPLNLEIIKPIISKCKELGIFIGANFVIGLPGETWEELRESFKFAEECDFDMAHFHIATPLPKTELYEIAVKNKYPPDDFNFFDSRYFGFCRGFITTDEFTPEELMILRAYEYDRINFSTPEKITKASELYGMSVDDLKKHRQNTRRKLGIHF